MRVRVGWSGEIDTRWQKADIELEEEDLLRLMLEHELPSDLHTRLPVKACYVLLANEAEKMLMLKLLKIGYPKTEGLSKLAELVDNTDSIISSIRANTSVAA